VAQEHAEAGEQLTRDESHARDRAAFLSGEADEEAEQPKAEEAKPDDETEAEEAEVKADEPEEAEAEEAEEADDEEDEPASKGIAAVRKAEQRSRARLAEERKALETERDGFVTEWRPRVEKAEKWESLASAVASNPYAITDLLAAMNIPEDAYEAIATATYAFSTKGKADPKNAQVIAQSRREREQAERIAALEKRDREREAAAAKAAEEARAAENGRVFMDKILTGATADKSPLLAAALAADKEDAQAELAQIAVRILDATGEMPSPKTIRAEFERIEAKRLKRYGKEVPAATIVPTTKTTPKKPGDKTTAIAVANENKTPSKAEILAEMEELERAGRLS
jgi:hypothetical protein